MPSNSIHGIGRQRKDDIYNRAVDLILRGQVTAMGGFYGNGMARLMNTPPKELTEVYLNHPDSGLNLIICGQSKCGGPDVCG
jgi:hypothetical protein